MSDEIKEILNSINDKYKDYYVQDIVSGDDLKLLFDYITNLQQENEKLLKICTDYDKQANKLKEDYVLLQNASDKYEDELQERIEKAVEYIKNNHNLIVYLKQLKI